MVGLEALNLVEREDDGVRSMALLLVSMEGPGAQALLVTAHVAFWYGRIWQCSCYG